MIPADRKTEGLILPMTIGENMTMSILGRLTRGLAISRSAERKAVGSDDEATGGEGAHRPMYRWAA